MTKLELAADFVVQLDQDQQLSCDVLSFRLSEQLNKPLLGEIEIYSFEPFDESKLLDSEVRLTIKHRGFSRTFLVFVQAILAGEYSNFKYIYKLSVADKLMRLTLGEKFRIYQRQSSPEIVHDVLARCDIKNMSWRLQSNFFVRNYCAQIAESDMSLVNRLLYDDGINYFVDTQAESHAIVFSEKGFGFSDLPSGPVIHCLSSNHSSTWDGPFIDSAREHRAISLNNLQHVYFDPEKQDHHLTFLASEAPSVGESHSYFDMRYMGRQDFREYLNEPTSMDDWGQKFASRELSAKRVMSRYLQGISNHAEFAPGYRFEMVEHSLDRLSQGYVLTQTTHIGVISAAAEETANPLGDNSYKVEFRAVPEDVCVVPWQEQKAPRVNGFHMAKVWGPPGMTGAYHDRYGRVKVQFTWDTEGRRHENLPPSCWIHAIRESGGNENGSMQIPEIGDMVLVGYRLGDPEQPYIMGAVLDGTMIANRAERRLDRFFNTGTTLGEVAPEPVEDEHQIFGKMGEYTASGDGFGLGDDKPDQGQPKVPEEEQGLSQEELDKLPPSLKQLSPKKVSEMTPGTQELIAFYRGKSK